MLKKLSIPPIFLFGGFALFTLLTVFGAFYFEQELLLVLPFVALIAAFIILELKKTYLLLFLVLPISIEVEVGSSLATSLPTEPLMVLLMFICFAYYMAHPKKLSKDFFNHPITLFLFLHILWIAITACYSLIFLVSLKFLLAKTWFVATCFFMTALFIKEEKDFRSVFWCFSLPLCLVICWTIARHASHNFGFQEANIVMGPFFRNHVNYAVTLAFFYPFLFLARTWYKKGSLERLVVFGMIVLFSLALFLAYTRAAYLSIMLLPIMYWVFKKQLVRYLAPVALVVVLGTVYYYSIDNRFLELAPDFATTIYHENFDDHLSATFEGKDVSFMERIYRWIAAFRMSADRPLTGFGPGNFYNFYQPYAVSSFETYVSDNPERSGVHNYFLMVLVEQGIIGLLLFLGLCITAFIRGEWLYQQAVKPAHKYFIMAILLALFSIILNILVSDLIEVDKIGVFFFMCLALLVNMELQVKSTTDQGQIP